MVWIYPLRTTDPGTKFLGIWQRTDAQMFFRQFWWQLGLFCDPGCESNRWENREARVFLWPEHEQDYSMPFGSAVLDVIEQYRADPQKVRHLTLCEPPFLHAEITDRLATSIAFGHRAFHNSKPTTIIACHYTRGAFQVIAARRPRPRT
jgi:hypothetical protein